MNIRRIIRFLPALAFMALIFYFSSLTGKQVAHTTQPLIDHAPTTVAKVRIEWLKVGHAAGYAGLGAALLFGVWSNRWKKAAVLATGTTMIYAVTDELHQMFVTGRNPKLSDVVLDVGAAVGAIVILLAGYWIVKRRILMK